MVVGIGLIVSHLLRVFLLVSLHFEGLFDAVEMNLVFYDFEIR